MVKHADAATRLATRASRLPGSGIREIFNLVAGRPGVLHLELGEPDFKTPDHIVEAAADAAGRGVGYTATAGRLDLREAIAAKLERVNGLSYEPDQILVTQGGVQGVAAVFAAFVEPGDDVVLPDPAWPYFEMLALLSGARPRFYGLTASRGFSADPGEVASLLGPRTKLLVINSPSNPTGAVFDAETMRALVEAAASNGTVVVSDEVYDELVFEDLATPAASIDPEWSVGVYSFSKTYAMTGWRVGYVASPRAIAPVLTRVQEPTITCVSEVSQAAALAALTGPQDCVEEMRCAYRRRRDVVIAKLTQDGLATAIPRGAFYLMYPLRAGADSRAVALALAEEESVAVAPGSAFGRVAADHLRISLASSEATLVEALTRISRWRSRHGA
jgi:aspartate/methionine/tyrosine aminotransferase